MNLLQSLWDWLSIPSIGSLIGAIGVGFAIVSIIITRSVSRISSHLEYNALIGGVHSVLPQQVNITYAGVPVDKVSSSVFIIWSSGNKVIKGDALKTIDPLRIEAEEGTQILRHSIQKTNNTTNNVRIETNSKFKNSLLISFDFLNKKNGLRVEVLHTGTHDSINIKGTLIDVKFSNKKNSSSYKVFELISKKKKLFKLFFTILMTSMALFFLGALAYSFIEPNTFVTERPQPRAINIWVFRSVLLAYLLIPLVTFLMVKPSYPSSLRAENDENDG